MQYIDVHVTTHGDGNLDQVLLPTHISRILEDSGVLEEAGIFVRSVIVTDSNTGLSGSYRADRVQHKIDKAKGK